MGSKGQVRSHVSMCVSDDTMHYGTQCLIVSGLVEAPFIALTWCLLNTSPSIADMDRMSMDKKEWSGILYTKKGVRRGGWEHGGQLV